MENDLDLECLEEGNPHDKCRGTVTYCSTGYGRAWPRCEHHFQGRLDREQTNRERYPMLQPHDFDPLYAGERWDDDY